MDCPKCNAKTSVIATRQEPKIGETRRRKCLDCDHRFTTIEVLFRNGNKLDRQKKIKSGNLFPSI
ncbi:MAG: hypothetical protein ACRC78_12595 [Planktothrix sp.]